tara:strand:- start:485 stop:733 length:249 start_codon:yes stop_codon:yes gene_type:complete
MDNIIDIIAIAIAKHHVIDNRDQTRSKESVYSEARVIITALREPLREALFDEEGQPVDLDMIFDAALLNGGEEFTTMNNAIH